MIEVLGERGSGKTTKLMYAAKGAGAVFVCASPSRMIKKANVEGIKGLEFATYQDLINGDLDGKKYVVDDMPSLFNLMRGDIVGYSISKNE